MRSSVRNTIVILMIAEISASVTAARMRSEHPSALPMILIQRQTEK